MLSGSFTSHFAAALAPVKEVQRAALTEGEPKLKRGVQMAVINVQTRSKITGWNDKMK